MSFSSGTFSLVTGNPVVTGTTITSTWANNTLTDIATGLTTCVLKDGTQTTTASVPFVFGIAVTTGITTPSTTFAVANTTATTVNAFGAATTLNIGNAIGTVNFLGTFVTPKLGTPTSVTLTNATGLPQAGTVGLTTADSPQFAGINVGHASDTTITRVSAGVIAVEGVTVGAVATATTAGLVPTPPNNTTTFLRGDATFAAVAIVLKGYIYGFTLSNNVGTPNTILDVAAGYAADSAGAVMITGTAFTKSTAGTWSAGTGNNGMGTGLTIAVSTWYHVYAIINAGSFDVYFDTSTTAANAPASTTAYRYIGSFKTNASANILGFKQNGQQFKWTAQVSDLSGGSTTGGVTITVSTPLGFVTHPLIITNFTGNAVGNYGDVEALETPNVFDIEYSAAVAGQIFINNGRTTTDTSSQIKYVLNSVSGSLSIITTGYLNPHVAATA